MLLAREENVALLEQETTERRRGLRIRQSRPVKVFEPLTCRYFGGETADISSAGLRLQLPRNILVQPGGVLHIHVGTSNSGQALANHRQMMPARVVWIDPEKSEDDYTVSAGVEFLTNAAAQADAA